MHIRILLVGIVIDRWFAFFCQSFFFSGMYIDQQIEIMRAFDSVIIFLLLVYKWLMMIIIIGIKQKSIRREALTRDYSNRWYFAGSASCLIAFYHLIRTCENHPIYTRYISLLSCYNHLTRTCLHAYGGKSD